MTMDEGLTGSGTSAVLKKTITGSRSGGDVYARLSSSCSKGRGSLAGWVKCPLCPTNSNKRFSCGRGIAAHLHAVHTPWNPSAVELRRRRKKNSDVIGDRPEKRRRCNNDGSEPDCHHGVSQNRTVTQQSVAITDVQNDSLLDGHYEPTSQELEEWHKTVSQITMEVEEHVMTHGAGNNTQQHSGSNLIPMAIVAGHNRLGRIATSYEDSLPVFIQCAANGDLEELKKHVEEKRYATSTLLDCLDITDRNGSMAEEWAAGKGHVDCLEYLLTLRRQCTANSGSQQQIVIRKKRKKREQKSALHWAARHGHINCVDLILSQFSFSVDDAAGDGTTPLHYACYGGHLVVVQRLIHLGADLTKCNDWGCDCSHWAAMSSSNDSLEVCQYLLQCGVSFTKSQKQGHTPLHKAAQKKNVRLIQWLASSNLIHENLVDNGGNKPSDIFIAAGGEVSIAKWMIDNYNW